MLGGKMSNQDEDEVEDELEAMEREVGVVSAVPSLPDAPSGVMEGELPDVPPETPAQKAKRRREDRAAREQASGPIAA